VSIPSARSGTLALGLALLVAMAGCESAGPAAAPAVSRGPVGEVAGTWTGTWGGTPLTLAITEHSESAPYSGLYLGPWLISGQRYPGLAGIMTYASGGWPRSVHFNGWITSGQPFMVLIAAEPPDGPLQLRLKADGADRLTGEGSSSARWGPRGAVEVTRR
jgi:hypothetical protein